MSFIIMLICLATTKGLEDIDKTLKNGISEESEQVDELTLDDLIVDTSWPEPTIEKVKDIPEIPKELISESIQFRGGFDEKVDCFSLNPVLQKIFRWMFQPQSKKQINVKLFLSTRKNRRLQLQNGVPYMNIYKNTVVVIHGFMSNSKVKWIADIEAALLKNDDVNVIIVDWGGGSMSWKYWRAVGNTRVVGATVARVLQHFIQKGLKMKNIHCIGHSLGAHICSYTARKLGKIGRITGLDPAEPCFRRKGLNESDALFVDIIHTNAALLKRVGLNFGIPHPIGTIDFFPNGGQSQPGCFLRDIKTFSSLLPNLKKELEAAICSHGRSYEIFIDSIRSTNCRLWGREWDLSQDGAIKALSKQCTIQSCVPLGLQSILFPAKGTYYVPTLEKAPFCIRDVKAEKETSGWRKFYNAIKDSFRDYIMGK